MVEWTSVAGWAAVRAHVGLAAGTDVLNEARHSQPQFQWRPLLDVCLMPFSDEIGVSDLHVLSYEVPPISAETMQGQAQVSTVT